MGRESTWDEVLSNETRMTVRFLGVMRLAFGLNEDAVDYDVLVRHRSTACPKASLQILPIDNFWSAW